MIIKAPRPPKGERFLAASAFPQPKGRGPNGRRFCRVCHNEVGLNRRTVCNEDCEEVLLDLIDPTRVVEREEKGVCQLCGWDMNKLVRILHHARNHTWDLGGRNYWRELRRDVLDSLGLGGNEAGRITIYEFDHITPIIEGGRHERRNLRTLCIPCHKAETAALRKRLAGTARQALTAEYAAQLELV